MLFSCGLLEGFGDQRMGLLWERVVWLRDTWTNLKILLKIWAKDSYDVGLALLAVENLAVGLKISCFFKMIYSISYAVETFLSRGKLLSFVYKETSFLHPWIDRHLV